MPVKNALFRPIDDGAQKVGVVPALDHRERAGKAALTISRSLVCAHASGSPTTKAYARTSFPFGGKARLRVRGRAIKGGDYASRFLVDEILSCSATFPFERLQYVAATRMRPMPMTANNSTPSTDTDGTALHNPNDRFARKTSQEIRSQEPRKSTSVKPVKFEHDTRFLDLLSKPVHRVDAPQPTSINLKYLPDKPFQSTGRGTTSRAQGSRVDPELVPDERGRLASLKCPDTAWQSYFEFLKVLAKQPWVVGMTFVRLDPRQVQPHYCHLPTMFDEDGVVLEGSLPQRSASFSTDQLRYGSFLNLTTSIKSGHTLCSVLACLNPRSRSTMASDVILETEVMLWKMQVLFTADVLSLAATMINNSATAARLTLNGQPKQGEGCLHQAVQTLHELLKSDSAKPS